MMAKPMATARQIWRYSFEGNWSSAAEDNKDNLAKHSDGQEFRAETGNNEAARRKAAAVSSPRLLFLRWTRG